MNRLPATAHRLSIGLVALLLIAVGAAAVASQVDAQPVAGWVDRLDERAALDAAQASWWVWVLAGVTVIAIGWGLLLQRMTVRWVIASSTTGGTAATLAASTPGTSASAATR